MIQSDMRSRPWWCYLVAILRAQVSVDSIVAPLVADLQGHRHIASGQHRSQRGEIVWFFPSIFFKLDRIVSLTRKGTDGLRLQTELSLPT